MDIGRMREVCAEIAKDMENDADQFDGKPFNGRTVAAYLGNLGAAIAAVAEVVDAMLADRPDAPKLDPDSSFPQLGARQANDGPA